MSGFRIFGCDHAPLIAQLRADLAAAEANADEFKRLHEMERRRYDELLQTTLALKVARAEVVPVVGGVVEPAPVLPPQPVDELKVLIHSLCVDDTRKRGMMLRQLAVDRAAGVPEEEIEQAIRTGVSSDGIPA